LVELRTALAQIKSDAEHYIEESGRATEALRRLTTALSRLRALKLYNDPPIQEQAASDPLTAAGLQALYDRITKLSGE
jgi:hypothetical protein